MNLLLLQVSVTTVALVCNWQTHCTISQAALEHLCTIASGLQDYKFVNIMLHECNYYVSNTSCNNTSNPQNANIVLHFQFQKESSSPVQPSPVIVHVCSYHIVALVDYILCMHMYICTYVVKFNFLSTTTPLQVGCIIVTTLLHYFFLAVFCWALCEGIVVFIMLWAIFRYRNIFEKIYWFLLLGWGKLYLLDIRPQCKFN